MSVQVRVFIAPDRVPTRDQILRLASNHGLALTLDPAFEPAAWPGGFVPASVQAMDTGFEFYLGSDADSDLDSAQRQFLGDRSLECAFRIGGDPLELTAALWTAGLIALSAEGAMDEAPTGSGFVIGEEAWSFALDQVRSLRAGLDKDAETASRPLGEPIPVETFKPGWIKCPRCRRSFCLTDQRSWRNGHCGNCGQALSPVGELTPVPWQPNPAQPRTVCRPWWRLW